MSDKRFELVESICNEVGKQQIEIMDNLKKQILDKQKIADLLNELSEEREYFERKKEYFLSKWSIANTKNIQLRQKTKELEEENKQLMLENARLKATLEETKAERSPAIPGKKK